MDTRIRDLEKRVAQGDNEAQVALRFALNRLQMLPPDITAEELGNLKILYHDYCNPGLSECPNNDCGGNNAWGLSKSDSDKRYYSWHCATYAIYLAKKESCSLWSGSMHRAIKKLKSLTTKA